jgi:hypothetical protein
MKLSRLLLTTQIALLSRKKMILRRVPRLTDDLKIICTFILDLIFLVLINYRLNVLVFLLCSDKAETTDFN